MLYIVGCWLLPVVGFFLDLGVVVCERANVVTVSSWTSFFSRGHPGWSDRILDVVALRCGGGGPAL